MKNTSLRTLKLILARLERISADSVTAHRASGIRGGILRAIEQLENQEPISDFDVKHLIEWGYLLLQRAAEEKVR